MTTIRVVGQFDAKSHPGVIRKMITSSTSPVGNPFVVGLDGDRKTVCESFEHLVWCDWEVNCEAPGEVWDWVEARVQEYTQGKDLELCCRCRPKEHLDIPCHGETLRDWILWLSVGQNERTSLLIQGVPLMWQNNQIHVLQEL